MPPRHLLARHPGPSHRDELCERLRLEVHHDSQKPFVVPRGMCGNMMISIETRIALRFWWVRWSRFIVLNFITLLVFAAATTSVHGSDFCETRLVDRLKARVSSALGYTARPDSSISFELRRRVRQRDDQFVIPQEVVAAWSREFRLTPRELMIHFLPFVAETARPPSSEYYVGNVGLTQDGDLVIGNNLEFPPLPHVFTVHGETFLIALAYLRGLSPIVAIAMSGPACGHCRQFMYETVGAKTLVLYIPDHRPTPLRRALPRAFDPRELGVAGLLLTPQSHAVKLPGPSRDPLALRALAEARRAYAPYSKRPAGVALRTSDGQIFGGPYIEIVNYNASMDPMAAALVDLVSHGKAYADVRDVILAELPSVDRDKDISFDLTSRGIAAARLPNARFVRYLLEPDSP